MFVIEDEEERQKMQIIFTQYFFNISSDRYFAVFKAQKKEAEASLLTR